MGISLDGLSSGLDTTALIDALMGSEAIPQNILKNKVASTQTMVSALQALNTKVSGLAELAKNAAKPDSLQLFTATASSDVAKAKAGSTAAPGSLEFVVNSTSQAQVAVSGAASAWPQTDFTITKADGTAVGITAASTSLDDVVNAVNNSEAGVKAVKVSAGGDLFRLQFTSQETGTAGKFTYADASGQALTEVRTAQDASVTLWKGTAAEQVVTSSNNTFTGLLPGVDVTVSKVSAEPVTVSVARDSAAAGRVAEGLVNSLNGLFSFIASNSAVTSVTDGGATKSMIFTGDSTARDVNQRIMSAATLPVDGRSPSEIGISITRDGTIKYDVEKFQAALTADPKFVESALQEIAGRISTAAAGMSDKYDGEITSRIKGQESSVTRFSDQVLDWDRRLASRRATLEKTYAAMEVQLSALNSQSSWLSSQLSSLPTSNGSS